MFHNTVRFGRKRIRHGSAQLSPLYEPVTRAREAIKLPSQVQSNPPLLTRVPVLISANAHRDTPTRAQRLEGVSWKVEITRCSSSTEQGQLL
jgi:hypothetical protein